MTSSTRRKFMRDAAGAGVFILPALGRPGAPKVHPLDKKIARLFVLNNYWSRPPGYFLDMVSDYGVGGVYMDAGACRSERALLDATDALYQASPNDLVMITDCEGGKVNRLRAIRDLPAPGDLGRALAGGGLSEDGFQKKYRERGRLLGDMNLNFNFDPVIDLAGAYIGGRSFGRDPETVATAARLAVRGYREAGIRSTAKHFPGLGSVKKDPHLAGMPVVRRSLGEMYQRDFIPFMAAIGEGVSAVLVTHTMFPALDRDRPASISAEVVDNFLRKDLGFGGLVWPDSMSMGAILAYYEKRGVSGLDARVRGAVDAIKAGSDLVFNFRFDNRDFPALVRGVRAAALSGEISEERIEMSILRISRTLAG